MKYHIENVADPITNIATFAAATALAPSTRNGISGFAVRASTRTNRASSATPPSSGSRVAAAVQPDASVCTMPYATEARPAVTSSAPRRSIRLRPPARPSASLSAAPISTSAPMGTLMSRTHRQDRASVSTPPTSPPAAPPPAPTAIQVPMALVLACPSGTAAVSRVSVAGASTAAPSPCAARAASSCQPSWARPPASEAAVNRPRPTRNIRLRP